MYQSTFITIVKYQRQATYEKKKRLSSQIWKLRVPELVAGRLSLLVRLSQIYGSRALGRKRTLNT
jgi:hypothetical protein